MSYLHYSPRKHFEDSMCAPQSQSEYIYKTAQLSPTE